MITNKIISPNAENRKVMCFLLYRFDGNRNKSQKLNNNKLKHKLWI
jgi:hypothetical protein